MKNIINVISFTGRRQATGKSFRMPSFDLKIDQSAWNPK